MELAIEGWVIRISIWSARITERSSGSLKSAACESGQRCFTTHYAIAEDMKTDAQKRAENAYRKAHVKQVVTRFYPNDEDQEMYDWLKSQENVTEYIKGLVAKDMEERRAD